MNYSLVKNFLAFTGGLVMFFGSNAQHSPKGFPLENDNICSVWWAHGAYKITRQDPVPPGKTKPVTLLAAANEYESVQLVISPRTGMKNFSIKTEELKNESGKTIPPGNITVRKVEYVNVVRPTDDYGKAGWYPDPLPLFNHPADLPAGENSPFYLTIRVPGAASPGTYKGSLQLIAEGWQKTIPVTLEVWNFSLPDKPSVRSSFGIGTAQISQYHNLETPEELREVAGHYYTMMKEYKIAPTSPFSLYPMKVSVEGLEWTGGEYSHETFVSGKKSLKVIDNDHEEAVSAFTPSLMEVNPSQSYTLKWQAKTGQEGQQYCIMLKGYDSNKNEMPFENRMQEYTGDGTWKEGIFTVRTFREEVKYVSVHLFPVFRDHTGRYTGTTWFDDVRLMGEDSKKNLIPQGDFEVSPEDLSLRVDFDDFDKAGKKFLDEMGFNAFNLSLEGLPSGTFFSQRTGVFQGFAQGTPEYETLMKKYLSIVEQHLEEMGWLGKEYVYWFDEPNTENYPFVREGMEIIHRSAPKITRFITEHQPGPDIMDVTEISCTVIGQLKPDIIKDLVARGREFWSYVCCCPKAPYLSLFIDHDDINMRMWLWLSYKFDMKGILVWSANYWNSQTASPEGFLQNPWEDPMSYTVGYGLPFGKQSGWGNGDGRFFYPPNRDPNDHTRKFMEGPVPCLRLENIRDGIEDFEYLVLLEKLASSSEAKYQKYRKEAQKLLALPDGLVEGPVNYDKDPLALLQYRNRIGQLLDKAFAH